MLQSARFIGNPKLEACLAGTYRMKAPDNGPAVLAVQQGLLDLGFDLGRHRDDGWFSPDTGRAVVRYKTERSISPNDAVVGPKTMGALDAEWALPFADREEWLSWSERPLPEWNFTRDEELTRRYAGAPLTLTPVSAWLPAPFRAALLKGLTALLDPYGSPDGPRAPSATWGASPLDLFHCHVVVDDFSFQRTLDLIDAKTAAGAYARRLATLRQRALVAGPLHSPAWTSAYRDLLLAPGTPSVPSVRSQAARILDMTYIASIAHRVPVHLVWHTFEHSRWRPRSMASRDPRRSWWNVVSPTPTGVSHTPFFEFASVVAHIVGLAFLVDMTGSVTVMAETIEEASAIVGLPMERVWAAVEGVPASVLTAP